MPHESDMPINQSIVFNSGNDTRDTNDLQTTNIKRKKETTKLLGLPDTCFTL